MGFLIAPLIIGAVLAVILTAKKRQQAIKSAWDLAGTKLGLESTGGGWGMPTLQGTIGGLRVNVEVYSTGGKNKTYYTRYSAHFPQKGTAIDLKRQTGLSRVTKFFGAQDVEIGDTVFDEAFMIKDDSAERAGIYLTLPRRTMLLKLFSLYTGAELSPDTLKIVMRGYEDGANNLVTHTRRLVSAARILAGLNANEPVVAESLKERLGGDMSSAAERLRTARDAIDDVDTQMLEAEMLTESGRLDEAQTILTELSDRLPVDEEVAGLQRAIGRMKPSEPSADSSLVNLQELLDDLFVSNRLSFETTEIFDEHYLGRPVSWSGLLKSRRDVPRDLDFQAGPGSKLVVAIAEVEHDLYGLSEVSAIVHVPLGTADHLERGDRVAFGGKLLKADSMMRNVFVESGRIV